MARKLRLEFPGAIYHLINRGNYRSWIFADDKTKGAFEMCLFEACERSQWLLHAFAIMGNHYHLAIETPSGNLVTSMQWLQATFACRFNRFRHEIRQRQWTSALERALAALGKSEADARSERKATPWKIAVAVHLKKTTQASNRWVTQHLAMGSPVAVSQYVSAFRRSGGAAQCYLDVLEKHADAPCDRT